MIITKVIRYENDPNTVEVTWENQEVLPDAADEQGNTIPGEVLESVVKCRAYHATQLDELRADLGADAAQYEALLVQVEAEYVPPPPPSMAEQIKVFDAALVEHLDATARTRRYDNRITCALRAGYAGPFQAEGQAFAAWMDSCNALAYQLLAEVMNGTRPMPDSPQALIDLLPAMVWPE